MTATLTKAQIEAERVLTNRRAAFVKRVRNLLGHVGQRAPQSHLEARFDCMSPADQVEYGPKADALAAELASVEPVGRALMPQKVEAVRSAREDAQKVIERVRKELEAAEWNIDAVAPYPRSFNMSREQYQRASAKRNLFSSLTERQDPKSYKPEAEKLVKMSDEGIARFISNSEQDAALQYDAFICKMVSKVGDVTDASITGEHVWGHSILTVTKRDGSSERWKTQQIVNYSVYGRPYLQWPSRIVK